MNTISIFVDTSKVVFLWTPKGSFIIYGLGGAAADANPYNSRESPYLRKRFFTCPLILPKDSENIVGLKFFAPP